MLAITPCMTTVPTLPSGNFLASCSNECVSLTTLSSGMGAGMLALLDSQRYLYRKTPGNQSCLLAVLVLTLHVGHASSSMSRTPIPAGPLAEAELFDHIADVCDN